MHTIHCSRMYYPVLFCFLLILLFQPVEAQEQQMEIVPGLEVIDRTLADKLQLFQDYADFEEARLFRNPDSTWMFEIYTRRNGQITRERDPISQEELETLRTEIRSRLSSNPSLLGLNQTGRAHIIAGSIPLGLYYGASLGAQFSDNNTRFSPAAPLLIGGGLIVTSITATKDKEITHAMGSMTLNGGLVGIGHGALITVLLDNDHFEGETFLGISSLTSIAEGLSFYSIAKNRSFTPGQGAMWNYGNFWGMGYGLGLSSIIGGENSSPELISAGGLAGSALGIWASQALYRNTAHSPGNIAGVSNLTINGAFLGLSFIDFADFEGTSPVAASLVGWSALGAFTGFSMMKNHRFNSTEGLYLTLGNLGGGLVGSGIGLLTGVESGGLISLLGVAGGLAGFLTVMKLIEEEGTRPNRSGFLESKGLDGLSVNLNPFSLFGSGHSSSTLPTLNDVRANSALHLRFSF